MKRPDERCFLCDSADRITRDHIPPKALCSRPLTADLITVPCCYDCNHGFHKQDELFRLFVSGAFNRNIQGDAVWKRVEERTIKRQRLKHEIRSLAESATMAKLTTPTGVLHLPFVTLPQTEISGTLIRIVKGLIFHHFPTIPRNDLAYSAVQVNQTKLIHYLDPILPSLLLRQTIGEGAFRYWAGLVKGEPRGGIWILMFYDSMAFAVFHKP